MPPKIKLLTMISKKLLLFLLYLKAIIFIISIFYFKINMLIIKKKDHFIDDICF